MKRNILSYPDTEIVPSDGEVKTKNMWMKKLINLLFVSVFCTLLFSCEKYLDVAPDNVATIEYAFRNKNEAEKYLFTCYSLLQKRLAYLNINPGLTMSGEVIYPYPSIDEPIDLNAWYLIHSTQNITAPQLNYWDGQNSGLSLFREIRKCNTFLENIHLPLDITESERNRWIAEAKFLKAYYQFWLLRMYGPIPVYKVNLGVYTTTDDVRVKRQPLDSVFNYIVELLDEAAPDLPDRIVNEASELGRITRPIALSIKAKVLVTMASPLYNGNPDYADFKDKDGQILFPTSYDAAKWENAALACKEAIDACEAAGIKSYEFVEYRNIIHASDTTKLLLTLRNSITDTWNSGIIWGSTNTFRYQNFCVPRLNSTAAGNGNIRSQWSVPIDQAELYYTNHGVPLEEDKTRSYADRYELKTAQDADMYYIRKGYTTIDAHFNREPRFYASLGFDGGTWFGNGVLDDRESYYVQAKNGQPAGNRDIARNNVTGYFIKKLVHFQSLFLDKSTVVDFYVPLMRISELYLLYAEALNEVDGPSPEVFRYLDSVRIHAGIPTVQDAWTQYSLYPGKINNQDDLREIIHREMRIETSFEGEVGWDLRRWKELQNVLNRPVKGWNAFENQPIYYYRKNTLFTPSIKKKEYLWPLREMELYRNPNLVQNPGW